MRREKDCNLRVFRRTGTLLARLQLATRREMDCTNRFLAQEQRAILKLAIGFSSQEGLQERRILFSH
jgi:hypothetical protein